MQMAQPSREPHGHRMVAEMASLVGHGTGSSRQPECMGCTRLDACEGWARPEWLSRVFSPSVPEAPRWVAVVPCCPWSGICFACAQVHVAPVGSGDCGHRQGQLGREWVVMVEVSRAMWLFAELIRAKAGAIHAVRSCFSRRPLRRCIQGSWAVGHARQCGVQPGERCDAGYLPVQQRARPRHQARLRTRRERSLAPVHHAHTHMQVHLRMCTHVYMPMLV